MSEGKKLNLRTGDALFNAALLGFARVMEYDLTRGKADTMDNELEFEQSDLQFFSARYLKKMLEQFKHQTPLESIYNRMNPLKKRLREGDFQIGLYTAALSTKSSSVSAKSTNTARSLEKEIVSFADLVIKKFDSASYKAAMEMLKEKRIQMDIGEEILKIKSLKKRKQYIEMLEATAELLNRIAEVRVTTLKTGIHNVDVLDLYVKDYFLIKDIIYININEFWNGIGFLHKQKNKTDYEDAIKDSFQTKAESFEEPNEKKTSISCSQCNCRLTKTQSENMSWINDMGVDIARKHSYFWNCSPDVVLCPVCKLVYSCIPMGFSMIGKNAVFVNSNESLADLSESNRGYVKFESGNLYYEVFKELVVRKLEKDERNMHSNLQVLWRSDSKYKLYSFSPDLVEKLYRCRGSFRFIEKAWLELDGKIVSVFEEALVRVMNGVRLDGFITKIFRAKLNNPGLRIGFLSQLININGTVFLKGGVPMRNKNDGVKKQTSMDKAREEGQNLYSLMVGKKKDKSREAESAKASEANEKKIRSISYRLLNAISLKNTDLFIDTIARQYLSMNMPIPEIMNQVFKSEDDFVRVGHSFLLGLNNFGNRSDDGESTETTEQS